jgi:pilus assembly protein CpaF
MGAGIDAVLHLGRDDLGRRVLQGIHVLERGATGLVTTVPALTRDRGRLVPAEGHSRLEVLLGRG